ncbi:MAG: T9SS type A sorting domain-containing protein, partial [Endomicrobiaceae bacterium]
GSTGKWLGINCEGGSSVSLNNVNITGAETGVRGVYNYKFSVTNSIFEACDKGISVTELVPTVSYAITGNTLTGTRAGTGVHVTSSNGIMKNNTISFFLYGARFTMCSPTVSNNTIFGNKIFGILVSGQNAIPQLINTDINQVAFPNNEIYNNGGTLNSPSELFLSAQIGIIPYANVYMYKGRNNIFSGIVNTTPLVPCISIAKLIASVNQNIIVKAAYNYWGSSSVNYDFFFEDHYQYSIEYTPYYVTPDGLVDPDEPNSQSSSTENKILTNAIRLESKDNVIPAIKLYEHIIKKYVDTAEYYIAMARLPYLYAIAELDNNELIAIYDEAYASEKTTNKKFFKGMKVATHIKGKRYDDAIAVAEEMKSEAEFDEEVTLADINIAIANLLKEMEGKSRSGVDYAENLHGLLSKLNSSEVTGSGEPTDITESVLPSEIKLYQNYPNPFNPVTQINFALAKNAQVKLSVYNISGQKVAELVNGTKQAGNHAVDFDGSKLNSGVYYYTLEVDGKSLTQKMILMK